MFPGDIERDQWHETGIIFFGKSYQAEFIIERVTNFESYWSIESQLPEKSKNIHMKNEEVLVIALILTKSRQLFILFSLSLSYFLDLFLNLDIVWP